MVPDSGPVVRTTVQTDGHQRLSSVAIQP